MMKIRKKAVPVLMAVMFLTACGTKADTVVTTEEIVVPEMSSKDILVNSLEYLLEEEPEKETEEEETGEEKQEEQEKRQEEGEKATVICYGKDAASGLIEETITAEEITPDVLLNALARHNIVPLLDTKALSMEEREEDGKKLLYLDLSGSFREYLMTMSMEAECIIISSIVNTFLANYDADAVYITVEGETLSTSHAEYTKAVSGYTPGELMSYLERVQGGEKEDAAEPAEQ